MPRYLMTITGQVSPGHPRVLVPLPGGAKLFSKRPGENEVASHEVTLTKEEAEAARRDGYDVVELDDPAGAPRKGKAEVAHVASADVEIGGGA